MIPFLAKQFAVGQDPELHPPGGEQIALKTITVTIYEGTEAAMLRSPDGELVGVLIGTPIDLETGVVRCERQVPGASADSIVEALYEQLAGSWLCVLDVGGARRVYLDANGTKSLVYDPERRVAGATAQILFPTRDDYDERLDYDRYARLGIGADGWFPAGLTAHRGVERLMANHYLDLDDFTAVRHWPRAPVATTSDSDGALRAMGARVTAAIGALAADRPTHVALTAGNETRLLLACCRRLLHKVDFFTSAAPGAELDVVRARELAARFELHHEVLMHVRATDAQADAWLRRVGHSLTGSNLRAHPSVWPLRGYMVGGSSGEVARGFLWLNADGETPLTGAGIVDRLKLPRDQELVRRVDAWLADLPFSDSLFVLDLAYIELRMSSWGYAQAYANPSLEAHHVLVSRANFEAMLSLPEEMRRGDTAVRHAVKLLWPELLTLPINRYGDWRDRLTLFRKLWRRPQRLFAKLRQLRARN